METKRLFVQAGTIVAGLFLSGQAAHAATLVWNGVSGQDWDVGITQNWLDGGIPAAFANADVVDFNDPSANQIINLPAIVSPTFTTVTNTAMDYVFSGPGAIGTGNFAKNGTGKLTIATLNNTYTGSTAVNGGTLFVDGSLMGTGPTFALQGATLGGTGIITGSAVILAAGTVAPGHDGIGTLSTGPTTIRGTYGCELDGATCDLLAVTGDLDLIDGTLEISILNPPTLSAYVIATYSGTRPVIFPTVSNLPSGCTVDYSVPGQVRLIFLGMLTFGPGAVITGENVAWTLPCGTDVTHLSPTYSLSPQTTGDPPSGTIRDFSTPQTYTVYDDVTQSVIGTYIVTVRLQGPPQPFLLFNTGVDANAEVLAVGAVDPHYTLTARPPGSGTNVFAVNAAGGWLANTTTSQWIAPGASGSGPGGSYTYRMAFNVPCVDNAVITGRWAADNDGSIVLNGSATPVATLTGSGSGNFTTWHPFTITSGLIAGLNTLDFNVINNGGRTGLRVELTGTTTCCCPPTETVLLNTGYNQNTGAVYPLQAADAFWWVTSDPTQPGTTLPRPATVIQPNGAWSQPMANSQWLSSYPTEVNNLNGEYVFETYFCLQPDASNVVANVCLRADDAAQVYLNGHLLATTPPLYSFRSVNPTCGTASMAANPSWFLTGQNVIQVRVQNLFAVAMGLNLTGSVTGSGLSLQSAACCRPASGISGQKFFDFNQNGSRDAGEPALPGWTMQLSNGATAITDANGYYYFQNLAAGTYAVTEVPQATWTQSAPAGGSHTVTLGVAQQVNGRDFGNWKPNDPNCPVLISCPGDIVAECTGSGAEVAFNTTATSQCGNNPVKVICTPPSTTLFPIGTTTVKCTALDSQNNWAECSFTVTVVDTTPPVITCPDNIVVDSCTNLPVVFAAIATDNCSSNATVVCTPPSGSVFGAGTTTTVTCVATDHAGLSSSCQFTVTVNLRGAVTTQTVILQPGDNYVTCQVDGINSNQIGDETFLSLAGPQLDGLQLLFGVWDNCQLTAPANAYSYIASDWYDDASAANANSLLWLRDQTICVRNPSATPVTLTLTGNTLCTPVAKTLAPCCLTLLGSQVAGSGDFYSITGHPASDYTRVELYRYPQPPNGGFNLPFELATTYTAATGVWSPPFPVLKPGEGVLIKVNCCPPTETVLLNTGYNQNTGAVYPLQAADAFWWVTSDPTQPGTTLPRPATVIQRNAAWSQPMADSQWLSSYPTEVNNLNGEYVFETYFCLQPDASNVVVNVCLRADDAADVYLNGNLMVATPPLYSFRAATPACGTASMAANSGWFLTGQNVIQVRVRNLYAVAMGMNLTGSVTGSGLALQSAACCRPASGISGQKFFDFNQNGNRNAGEPALPGFTMQLSNGATATTDVNGYYYFQNLVPGTYTVTEAPQSPWTQTAPAGGSHTVTLGVAQQVNGRDFGNWKPNDPNCPVLISCPSNIVAECTGSGAEVAFNTTATSQCGNNPVKVICTPPSTHLFPVGTTTVDCTALDSQNNWAECSFTVTVVDTTPPVITCPDNIVVESCTNVPVVFAATATDGCSSNVTMVCTPPSGSVFGAGTTTTVTCVATDEAGLSSSCSFTVTVQGPPRSFLLANTGVGPSAAVLADGLVDPHYTLTANPNGGSPNALASSAYASWLANTATSKWIGVSADGAGATGTYTYQMTFNVPSLENAVITGQWAADNNGSIVLNGSGTPVAILTGGGPGNFTTWHPFTITSGLQLGLNTLVFTVTNDSGPTGLRVELTGSMTCCSAIIDSDGDGISDTWEFLYGLDPVDPKDGRLDLDGDGMTNFKEFAFGLDPTSGASVNPITQMLDKTTGKFRYTRRDPSVTGLVYTVQTSTDLLGWTDDTIATAGQSIATVSGDVQTMAVTLGGSPQTVPRLFVRVKAERHDESCTHP